MTGQEVSAHSDFYNVRRQMENGNFVMLAYRVSMEAAKACRNWHAQQGWRYKFAPEIVPAKSGA